MGGPFLLTLKFTFNIPVTLSNQQLHLNLITGLQNQQNILHRHIISTLFIHSHAPMKKKAKNMGHPVNLILRIMS